MGKILLVEDIELGQNVEFGAVYSRTGRVIDCCIRHIQIKQVIKAGLFTIW